MYAVLLIKEFPSHNGLILTAKTGAGIVNYATFPSHNGLILTHYRKKMEELADFHPTMV